MRRGDYKTAPELFTHAEVSDIQRQTLEQLLDERYDALVDAMARGRRLTPNEAAREIDEGPYSARRAQAQGLVDWLASEVELAERLAPEGRKEEDGAKPRRGSALPRPGPRRTSGPRAAGCGGARGRGLAMVPVKGMIVHGEGGEPRGRGWPASEALVKALRGRRASRARRRRCSTSTARAARRSPPS